MSSINFLQILLFDLNYGYKSYVMVGDTSPSFIENQGLIVWILQPIELEPDEMAWADNNQQGPIVSIGQGTPNHEG